MLAPDHVPLHHSLVLGRGKEDGPGADECQAVHLARVTGEDGLQVPCIGVPQPDGLVLGAAGKHAGVGAEAQRRHDLCVPLQHVFFFHLHAEEGEISLL